jgi:general secretion pathway protein B
VSYILDALKKSEQERNAARGETAHAGDAHLIGVHRASRATFVALFVVLGIAATALLWRHGAPPATPVAEAHRRAPAMLLPEAPEISTRAPQVSDELAREAYVPTAPAVRAASLSTPVVAAVSAPTAPTAAPPLDPTAIPFLRQMPDAFRRGLPPMTVNIHVYSSDPSQCVLYINNRQYRDGEDVGSGVRVEKIVQDGAVLSYDGRYFKLERPN